MPLKSIADTSITPKESTVNAAKDVLTRSVGSQIADRFSFSVDTASAQPEGYSIKVNSDRVHINASSSVALTRGAYAYLKQEHNNMLSWSGANISMPNKLADYQTEQTTPFKFRYYLNVVTHGYTTAYWDWARWEQEIDWMAMHGMNMPLLAGAHEAILFRVFRKLGFSEEQSYQYFSGPAHFPWNRMGNIVGWDGANRLPKNYFDKQIALNHKILARVRELGMTPIIHAFAGFVPPATKALFPDAQVRELSWAGGLPSHTNGRLLSPTSPLFVKIGKMYIDEWEKEFGKNEYYLADSFNEMDVPKADTEQALLSELAGYGSKVYESIRAANPDATWVMQGWTFPYHKDSSGELFWTAKRLHALVSTVPDDKLLILDLANEYNKLVWNIDPSWKIYSGFFNKQWIYSFIPNMGGKTPLNGVLEQYASMPVEALNYSKKGNLVGFGFAPEGIENNEMIYELLTDVAWQNTAIDIDKWQRDYATQRYGAFPKALASALKGLNKSALGSFTDHPMFRYQLRPNTPGQSFSKKATVHQSENFTQATAMFLSASELNASELYRYDAIELAATYLGLVADDLLEKFLAQSLDARDYQLLEQAMSILGNVDKLLLEHPNHRLENWVTLARSWGDSAQEKDYYESNAKRLLTTWGGKPVNDYAGRMWNGLISDYYMQRWQVNHEALKHNKAIDLDQWEENWLNTPYQQKGEGFVDPLAKARQLFKHYQGYFDKP